MSLDVIVVGLGAMGAAATAETAARGCRVLAFDRFTPPHDLGSTHGETRLIRQAYFEDPAYVPLARAAWRGWLELGEAVGEDLLHRTGALMIGPRECEIVAGAIRSARRWELPYELLEAAEVSHRHPALRLGAEEVAVWEEAAGILSPERCLELLLLRAQRSGADLAFGERVLEWRPMGEGVEVTTDRRRLSAAKLILAAGPWSSDLLAAPLRVTRQIVLWIRPEEEASKRFRGRRFPVFVWETAGRHLLYGFPPGLPSSAVKIGLHDCGAPTTADAVDREVRREDREVVQGEARGRLRGLGGEVVRSAICLYTNTPDQHFLLGLHPDHPAVAVAAGFSGHGFKFAPVVGEILADLLERGATSYDIDLFRPDRFLFP